ncbi:TPA: DMT family transporter [Streptococcus suis]
MGNDRLKGIGAILISALGFSMMNLLIPLAGDLPTVQKSFFRNLVAFLVAVIILLSTHRKTPVKELKDPKAINWPLLFLRSLMGTIGIWCNFYAMDHLYIADASVLNKLSPFAVLIFSHLFLKERMTKFHLLILGLAFVGVLLVVQPSLSGTYLFPYFVGIGGGLAAGAAYTCVRHLSKEGMTPAFIVCFFSAFSCIVSIPQLVFAYVPMTGRAVLILLGVGLMAAIGQFGITLAYKFAPAAQISVYDYSAIIFTGILGFLFLNQRPDGLSLLGYGVIIIAGILTFFYNSPYFKKSKS